MFNSTFKIIYAIGYLIMGIVRRVGMRGYRREPVEKGSRNIVDTLFLCFAGVGMMLPAVYVFSDSFDFADYYLPDYIGYMGIPVFLFAIWLLWRSHYDLGRNWTEFLGIRKGHKLITSGIFKYIRHPMYAAHLYWGVAQFMMLHNWIVGPSIFVVFWAVYLFRVEAEERMMIEEFGKEYEEYMKKTGRLFPKVEL